jgi:hypothetical protein
MVAALFVAIFISLFIAFAFVFVLSGEHWRAAQDKAGERRTAEHRMNARLLKLNI